MGSKNNPGSFDCYDNALPDEPMFVLLARDPLAPVIVEQWAIRLTNFIAAGQKPESDRAKVEEALCCADAMRAWRAVNNGVWRTPARGTEKE